MKTLKKTLCLVLAVVMVLGLGVMSASAKLDNYADENAITYREAVDVMSGIGVLQGDAGGFRPTDSVKRSEAAKIIAYLLIGNATQADALKTNSDPFTDVPATHWAAGYIAYCANAGIISGMGDGTFAPDAQVTGLQFAKMLLSAIGYNANDEYSGADWSINVSKDALRLGVFDDNLAGATNAPATREECALYAFNAAARERDNVYGLAKVSYSALLGGYISQNSVASDAADANKARTIADDFKLKKDDRDEDDFERDTGHYWYIDDARKTVITADYDENGHLKATYTTGVTGDDIYQLLGKDASASDTVLDFYLNGKPTTETASAKKTEIAKDNFKKGNGETLDHTGNGVQTYVYSWYDNGDMYIKICIIDTYLAQVEDVTAGTSTKDPVTKVSILYGWDADNGNKDTYAVNLDNKGFNTEEFEEDDYVLITATYDGKIKSMEPVKTVENNISRYNKTGKKITVTSAGTDYVAAKNTATNDQDLYAANDEGSVNKNIVDGEKHTLYVDNYGYLIAVADVEADSSYVYAAHFGLKNTTGEFDGSDIAVKLYYADGTSKIVTLNTKNDVNGDDDFKGADADNIDVLNLTKVGLYKLTMKSGKAVLSNADINPITDTPVKKGISSIDSTRADSKTVFFYVKVDSNGDTYAWDSDDFAVNVYTGINSVPTNKDKHADNNYADAVSIAAVTTPGSGISKAKAVLVKDSLDGDTTDTVYFFTGDYNVDESDWTVTYETYVNGKLEPLEISYKDKETKDEKVEEFMDETNGFVNKFFTLNGKNEPIATKLVDTDGTTPKAVNKAKYDDGLTLSPGSVNDYDLTDDNGTVFSIDGMKIIDLTGNDDIISSAKALKKAAESNIIEIAVQYADNSSNTISYLYLVQNDAP